MSDAPEDGKEPNLELPSLHFGFRRKKKGPQRAAESPPAPETDLPAAPQASPSPAPVPVERTAAIPVVSAPVQEAGPDPTPGPRRDLRLPRIDDRVAAVVTGLLSGLVIVALGYVATQGCAWVDGNGDCGALGLFSLVLILVAAVVFGAVLLRAWQISDPTSTSILGIGLVAVLALVFFLSSLQSAWMVVVLPVLTALTYLVSWWVTTTFVETD